MPYATAAPTHKLSISNADFTFNPADFISATTIFLASTQNFHNSPGPS
jgi:hypothetical protein